MDKNSLEKLVAQNMGKKNVCLGLDTVWEKIPDCIKARHGGHHWNAVLDFNCCIIDATHDLVAAYKPNLAFYIAGGYNGVSVLERTFEYIRQKNDAVLTIIDAKSGDIDNTNNGYADFFFNVLKADAATLAPYMGGRSLAPFLGHADKLFFVLCATSNDGAGEFQDLEISSEGVELFRMVAENFSNSDEWNKLNNIGLVAGATYPKKVAQIREQAKKVPILIPGIGKQSGFLEETLDAVCIEKDSSFLFNSSRDILYASAGDDFAEIAREKVKVLQGSISKFMAIKF